MGGGGVSSGDPRQPTSALPLPPQNLEAEQALLGALMNPAMDGVTPHPDDGLTRDEFYHQSHRLIFDAIRKLRSRNEPTDVLAVTDELSDRLDRAGGRAYLFACVESVAAVAHAEHYAKIVKDAATRRKLIFLAESLIHKAYGDEPIDALIGSAAGSLDALSRPAAATLPFRSGFEILQSAEEAGEMEFLPLVGRSGYIVRGWSQIISGLPKTGKTELIWSGVRVWLAEGERVLWLSEESESVWRLRLATSSDSDAPLSEDALRRLTILPALGIEADVLLRAVAARDEGIVVVDTTRTLMNIVDEINNSEIARVFGRWESALAGKTRLYLHHARKQAGEHGTRVSGGNAFLACVDRAIEVDYAERDNQRKLTVSSRLVIPEPLLYELRDGRLLGLGRPDAIEVGQVVERAKELLTATEQTTSQILAAFNEPRPNRETLRQALTRLAGQGFAERNPPLGESVKGKKAMWRLPQGAPEAGDRDGPPATSETTNLLSKIPPVASRFSPGESLSGRETASPDTGNGLFQPTSNEESLRVVSRLEVADAVGGEPNADDGAIPEAPEVLRAVLV